MNQPFGDHARSFTGELELGTTVTVIEEKIDRYRRLIASVVLPDGRNLSHEIVAAGFAWWYSRMSRVIGSYVSLNPMPTRTGEAFGRRPSRPRGGNGASSRFTRCGLPARIPDDRAGPREADQAAGNGIAAAVERIYMNEKSAPTELGRRLSAWSPRID
jgi:hypothetical protein